MIYFAQKEGEQRGPVKIGYTQHLGGRRGGLQIGDHRIVHFIRTINGSVQGEKWLHRYFKEHRIRGEWFHYRDEMMTIEPPADLPIPEPKNQVKGIRPGKQHKLEDFLTPEKREELEKDNPVLNAVDEAAELLHVAAAEIRRLKQKIAVLEAEVRGFYAGREEGKRELAAALGTGRDE